MSRRAFRISVEESRPASAWALVTVASATLWLTQQLAVWTVAIQLVAIALSFWRRRAPFGWQTNPIALNFGMMGVTGATIHVALQGGPATLGLAHFAALAQGLQLIDARPRRTEFLLVALALFQVILASNLTDSVFFTPLLVAFLFAAAWTLMVHTLRSEAAEAGDRQGASLALTPLALLCRAATITSPRTLCSEFLTHSMVLAVATSVRALCSHSNSASSRLALMSSIEPMRRAQ